MVQKVAVTSAKQATEIAESLLKKYAFRRPIKAQRTGDTWEVQIDVGVWKTRVATFKIDAKSGDVLEYAVPEAES